jgi:hypothetical protein
MTDRLMIPVSKKADLVVTEDNLIVVRPGLLSDAVESIEIGPLSDETIEHLQYALQRLRTHA